jgi:hypothetical protein
MSSNAVVWGETRVCDMSLCSVLRRFWVQFRLFCLQGMARGPWAVRHSLRGRTSGVGSWPPTGRTRPRCEHGTKDVQRCRQTIHGNIDSTKWLMLPPPKSHVHLQCQQLVHQRRLQHCRTDRCVAGPALPSTPSKPLVPKVNASYCHGLKWLVC